MAQGIGLVGIAVTIVCLAGVAYLGWPGYGRAKAGTERLVEGREVRRFIMGMSYGAGFIAIPLSIVRVVIVSLFTGPSDPAHLARCFGAAGGSASQTTSQS